MAEQKQGPPERSTGWVVAAIVAVVAVCAVTFMITQRPQEAMAVAEGDPLTGEVSPAPQMARTTPGGAPEAIRIQPMDGADTGRLAVQPVIPPPSGAMNANGAAANASAVEPAH